MKTESRKAIEGATFGGIYMMTTATVTGIIRTSKSAALAALKADPEMPVMKRLGGQIVILGHPTAAFLAGRYAD